MTSSCAGNTQDCSTGSGGACCSAVFGCYRSVFKSLSGARQALFPRAARPPATTGGLATSICDSDYTPALKNLGLPASGLRSDLPLSRAPISTSIPLVVPPPPGGFPAPLAAGPATWQYVGCENHTAVNVLRFSDAARPAPGSKIAASYDVNVRGVTCP